MPTPRTGPGILLVPLVAVLAINASCVAPSRTMGDYHRKVANTAEAMTSIVQSARLTLRAAKRELAPGPYISLRLSESESDADAVISSFSTVQPPSRDLDRLRADLLAELEEAHEILSTLQIAAGRGELSRLTLMGRELEAIVENLDHYLDLASA